MPRISKSLTIKKETFICEHIAQMKPYSEIVEDWAKENPVEKPITKQAVYYFVKTRNHIIEDTRQKILEKRIEKAIEVPIANEKIRLQRMEHLYNTASGIRNTKDMVGTSLDCLKEARQEVKGDSGSTQNFLQLNQFNELTDMQLLEKKKELEEKFIELSKRGANKYA